MCDVILSRIQRLIVVGPRHRHGSTVAPLEHPGDVSTTGGGWTLWGVLAAVVIPILFGIVLIPFRSSIEQSVSLLMLLPVLLMAVLGGARLGGVAALSASVTFGVVHTVPYYQLTIDEPDDVIEMVILLCVGITLGWLIERGQHAIVGSGIRARELDATSTFLGCIGTHHGDALVEDAQRAIETLLSASHSRWRAGYRGTAAPVLTSDGSITARDHGDPHTHRRGDQLPEVVEIPVGLPPREHGRIVVRSSGAVVSLEERRAAAIVASALGRQLDGRGALA